MTKRVMPTTELTIELIYEKSCPNIKPTREQLMQAFKNTGTTPHWTEWEVSDPDFPEHARGFGSPTILVNHRDVSAADNGDNEQCCRIYAHDGPNIGVPALSAIEESLIANTSKKTKKFWGLNLALLPPIFTALLPKLACPACWPAYAGVLSSLGIGFIDYTPWLLPLTSLFVLIALFALIFRAEQRRGYKPFVLGLIAGGTILLGKFYFNQDLLMYLGLTLLVIASLWNSWPRQFNTDTACPACVPSSSN